MNSPADGSDTPSQDVLLRLDGEDRIAEIGGDWSDLKAAGVEPATVVGRSLFDFVAGHFTRRFLRQFLSDVRTSGRPARRRYRCDSPATRRLMECHATPEAGMMLLEHRLIAEEPFAVEIRANIAGPTRSFTHARCNVCNRLRARRSTDWLEPEVAVPHGGEVAVMYTVCGDCRERGESGTLNRC